MHPELFSLGPISIKTYGFCMALGFLVAWQVLSALCRRSGKAPDLFANLVVYLLIGGVVGSRAAYVIEHWGAEFAARPEDVVKVWQGGLMFYGGLVTDIVLFLVWCWKRKVNFFDAADFLTVVIPLGHAFGRVGCFFYGCCYGRQASCALAVAFPRGSPAWHEQAGAGLIPWTAAASLPVIPTQLVEAAGTLLLFGVLYWVFRRFRAAHTGVVTGCYFVGYALLRFGMEYLRGDPRAAVGPFSIGQTISLILLAVGFLVIVVAFCRKKS